VDDNDPDQMKLPLDIEPIELARARYSLHVLGRVFVSGYRRFLKPNIVWLSLSVLSIAAGWELIEYTSARSEHSFPRPSVISVAILYPEKDDEFYLDKIPTFTVIPVNDGVQASLLITLAAMFHLTFPPTTTRFSMVKEIGHAIPPFRRPFPSRRSRLRIRRSSAVAGRSGVPALRRDQRASR
jgi:hypothetical protein